MLKPIVRNKNFFPDNFSLGSPCLACFSILTGTLIWPAIEHAKLFKAQPYSLKGALHLAFSSLCMIPVVGFLLAIVLFYIWRVRHPNQGAVDLEDLRWLRGTPYSPVKARAVMKEIAALKAEWRGAKTYRQRRLHSDRQLFLAWIAPGRTIRKKWVNGSFYLGSIDYTTGAQKKMRRAIALKDYQKVAFIKNIAAQSACQSMVRSEWMELQYFQGRGVDYLAIPLETALESDILISPYAGISMHDYLKQLEKIDLTNLATIGFCISSALRFLANPRYWPDKRARLFLDISVRNVGIFMVGDRVQKASLFDFTGLLQAGHYLSGPSICVTPPSLATEAIPRLSQGGSFSVSLLSYGLATLLLEGLDSALSLTWDTKEWPLAKEKRIQEWLDWRAGPRQQATIDLCNHLRESQLLLWAEILEHSLLPTPAARWSLEVIGQQCSQAQQITPPQWWDFSNKKSTTNIAALMVSTSKESCFDRPSK